MPEPTLDALATAGADGLDPDEGTPPFAAPTGYDSCHSTVCTDGTEAVARVVLEAAGVPGLLAERQKVRELHPPWVTGHRQFRIVTCFHCIEQTTGDGVSWPCDTAEIVYTAEEIAAVLRPEEENA